MRKKSSAFDYAVNLLCLALLLGVTLYILLGWNTFPERIPGHYNALGEVDRWGNRGELLFLPILSWILYGLITLVEQYPKAPARFARRSPDGHGPAEAHRPAPETG